MFGLGRLESRIMDALWNFDRPVKVREVQNRLSERKPLAYTTVMTVLENLHRKGWASRQRIGKAYWYVPALSREVAAAHALRQIIRESGDPAQALLHFAQSASDEESASLRDGLQRRSPDGARFDSTWSGGHVRGGIGGQQSERGSGERGEYYDAHP